MPIFLIAHTNDRGSNPAQRKIEAPDRKSAETRFYFSFPERLIIEIGELGVEGDG